MAQQRTHAWYAQRRGRLTASNLGYLLGFGKELKSRNKAYSDITGGSDKPGKETKTPLPCEWGQENEHNAIADYMSITGNLVDHTGFKLHKVYNWLGGSPDGLVGKNGLVEAKCPWYFKKDSSKLHTSVKKQYYVQMNALMEIFEREWCDYICWTPDEGMVVYRAHRDKELFDVFMEEYTKVWSCVQSGAEKCHKMTTERQQHLTTLIEASMEKIDMTMYSSRPTIPPPSFSDIYIEDADEVEAEGDLPAREWSPKIDECDGEGIADCEANRKRNLEGERSENPSKFQEVLCEEIQVQG